MHTLHKEQDSLQAAALRVPFFACLIEQDRSQFESLIAHCELHSITPGEQILRQGDSASLLYFIVTGSVDVRADGHYLGTLPAGETFGDMSLFVSSKRNADIAATRSNTSDTLVLAFDATCLGDLDDFSQISIASKLLFYRLHNQRARWRLEKNRIQFPHHSFFARLHDVKDVAANDDRNELKELHRQAVELTHMLMDWNALGIDFGSVQGATGS
ncbi:MAG: cyclic nucleotide-binding domain-containing protein [Pseudomonadales bacterium]